MTYQDYCQKRDKIGLSDHAIAKYTKISRSTFTQWKNGRLTPSERTMNKLKYFFDNYDPEHYFDADYIMSLSNGKQIEIETQSKRKTNSNQNSIYIDSITIPLNNGIPVELTKSEIIELKKYASIIAEAWLTINKNRSK